MITEKTLDELIPEALNLSTCTPKEAFDAWTTAWTYATGHVATASAYVPDGMPILNVDRPKLKVEINEWLFALLPPETTLFEMDRLACEIYQVMAARVNDSAYIEV